MKYCIKNILTIMALLLSTSVWAQGNDKFTFNYQLDGAASTAAAAGTVTGSISGTTATLTMTPANGHYITKDQITVIKTVSGNNAQDRTRTPDVSQPVEVTATDATADPSGVTTYTFTVTEGDYIYEVTANFLTKISISGATITLGQTSYTYTGEAIEPSVTKVALADGTELASTDYTVAYANNINVAATENDPQPTVTLTGTGKYTGTASTTFTITKADPTLTFSPTTATITFGNESAFVKPTLTTTPEGLAVTYESLTQTTATADAATGDITPVAAGEAEIKATFAGNANYNAKSASYTLTVAKGTATVSKAPTAKELTYTGEAQALINAGEAVNGGMQYKVGTDGTYGTEIPTGTDAKEYTVYYKAVATNANQFNDSEEASVTVTIGKAAGSISYATASLEKDYGDAAFTNALTITGDGTVSYESNNTSVATVDASTGEVTITGAGKATITATVADGTNYTYATKTATYTITVAASDMEVTAEGFEGTYDGEAHGITVTAPEGATIKYGTTEGTYNIDTNPTYAAAGTYTVYYQVTKEGYNPFTGSETVTIAKAAGSISYATTTVNKTVGDAAFTNALTNLGDGLVSYESSSAAVATINTMTGEVTIVGAGETIITATVTDGTNYTYATTTATYTLTVGAQSETAEDMEVTAEGFEGTYDGEAHGITVNAPEGAAIAYGTTEDAYGLDATPTYTDAGTYTIYYQVTKEGYNTVTGSATVTISKAAGSISYATGTVNKTVGDEAFTNALTITGDGTVSYASSNTDVATIDATTGKVTIAGVGSTTITATVADGTNYTYETKTATYTLTVAETQPIPEPDMEVTAEDVTVIYDGQPHRITVNAPEGAAIAYSTDGTTYNLEASPTYTDAGTYTIYYKVTKEGYNTFTGSAIVTINKAHGYISFDKEKITVDEGEVFTNKLTILGDGVVTYTSSDPTVAKVDGETGEVTAVKGGTAQAPAKAIITATVADGTNYSYDGASKGYEVAVIPPLVYNLWIGETQVTRANASDVFKDGEYDETTGEMTKSGSYSFNAMTSTLLITDNQRGVNLEEDPNAEDLRTITSELDGLTIFINGETPSKLKSIVSRNESPLTFTCEGNVACKLIIKNDEGESAISGFGELDFDSKWGVTILEPEGVEYLNLVTEGGGSKGNMLYLNFDGDIASTVTIGKPLNSLDKTIPMNQANLQQTDEDGNPVYDEDGNPQLIDTTNGVVDNAVLFTLPQSNNPDSGEGYNESNGTPGIGFVSTMTDDEVLKIANDVKEGLLTPGGDSFAEQFHGGTIQLPAAAGILTMKFMYPTMPTGVQNIHIWHFTGDAWHLENGALKTITFDHRRHARRRGITENSDGTFEVEIEFDVDKPTYCYLYMVEEENEAASVRPVEPIGKRETAHGKVTSIGVSVSKVNESNPPSEASGGVLPEEEDPVITIGEPDGIKNIIYTDNDRVGDGRWYNLEGQQIDEPMQKGLYIHNRKKIVIK